MLSVYTKDGFIPIETRQNYYYLMNYDGFHQLSFDVSVNDEVNRYLINEAIIKNEDNRFLIKDINRRTQNVTITCELDMDEWKKTIFFDTANDTRFQTKSLGDILSVIKPTGWTTSNSGIKTIKRTPELKDATPYDVLVSLEELFGVVFDINVLNKEIKVIDPDEFVYDGLYATRELNMKGVTWQGSSTDFCTKLFAYGKTDDNGNTVNIASVNNGKEYIENHTYTDKIITLVWRDERYTDPQSLYDDAKKKLDKLCIPTMSYDVSIYDLSQINKDYDFLQFGLYKLVKTMINEDLSITQKVVTYKKYYDKSDKNVVTLSNEQQKFTSKVSSLIGGDTNEIIHGSFLDQAKKESASIINEFATKGHKYETESETYYLDKLPKESAKCVMRMNLGGIGFSTNGWAGPYVTAWTIDGRFNADFISTGTLKAIRIEAAEIVGGNININDTFKVDENGKVTLRKGYLNIADKFIVDENGKLKCIDGEFSGKIVGGSIIGKTTINVGTDLIVGNNIYLNKASQGSAKGIYLNDYNSVTFNGSSQLQLNSSNYAGLLAGNSYTTPQDYSSVGAFKDTASMNVVDGNSQTSFTLIQGSIFSSTNITVSSDRRKKENIHEIDLTSLFDILKVYEFNYKGSNQKTVGVIAQDFIGTKFEDIILRKDRDGYYSVDYNVILMAVAQLLKKVIK